MMESFGAMAFRPQLWVKDYPSFEHNPHMPGFVSRGEEPTQPQVVAAHAWGAQNSSGAWTYTDRPDVSRARGGTADGGMMFGPPEFEMEDYFSINSTVDVDTPTTTSYLTAAPGVRFGLGTPNLDGGLNVKGIIIRQLESDTDHPLLIQQLDSSRVAQSLFSGTVAQSGGEILTVLGGTAGTRIPRGTTAQRTAVPTGGEIRVSTNIVASEDTPEFWDQQTTTWERLVAASKLASAANTEGASLIGVEDVAANFLNTDVEAVLAEMATDGFFDHGALTGLADDDHTQYILADGTRAFSGDQSMGSNDLVSIGDLAVGAASAVASAAVEIVSTTQGLLPPRMTTAQRDAISTPATGLTIYNNTTNFLDFYNGTDWVELMVGDYNLNVLRGLVTGHAMVSIVGHDSAIGTTRVTIAPSLAAGNIDQSSLAATAVTVDVASTSANDDVAGTGLLTLQLQGLDSLGAAQTEDITLTGATEVTSANTYSAITGWVGLTTGSGNTNDGVIWVGNGTFTAGVPATKFFSGDAEFNKGLTAYYVVPAGKTLYLRTFTSTIASSTKDVEFFVETSADGVLWVNQNALGMESGAVFPAAIVVASPGLVAGTHVRIEASSSAANTIVSATLGCELVDN